jgi:hypothetical protein
VRAQGGFLVRFVGSPYSENEAEPTLWSELPPYLEIERWLDGPDNDYDNEFEDDGTPLPEGERVIRFQLSSAEPVPYRDGRLVYTYEYVARGGTAA